MTEAQREQFEERAAILEFDAGLSRDEAEKRAREMMGLEMAEFEQGQQPQAGGGFAGTTTKGSK